MNPNEFVLKAKFKALEGGRTWNYPALYQGLHLFATATKWRVTISDKITSIL